MRGDRDQTGDQHTDAADRVGDHLHVGALDGQALRRLRSQQQRDRGVGGQSDQSHDDHRDTRHLGCLADPPDRLAQDQRRHPDQQYGVGDGGEHLGAMPAVGAGRRRAAALGEDDRAQAHEGGSDVGQDVPGIGQQRDRADRQRGGQFDDEEPAEQRGGYRQSGCGGAGARVIMACTHSQQYMRSYACIARPSPRQLCVRTRRSRIGSDACRHTPSPAARRKARRTIRRSRRTTGSAAGRATAKTAAGSHTA